MQQSLLSAEPTDDLLQRPTPGCLGMLEGRLDIQHLVPDADLMDRCC